jgi:hypothetical protein
LYEGLVEAAQSTEAADALACPEIAETAGCSAASALYQGTTLVVPPPAQNDQGFSPCKGMTQGLKPNFVSDFLRHD